MEAPELDGIADHVGAIATSPHQTTEAPIQAELIRDKCSALGITARGSPPVLAVCRELLAADRDPATPLEALDGDVLALPEAGFSMKPGTLATKAFRGGAPPCQGVPPSRELTFADDGYGHTGVTSFAFWRNV
ncbi:MAG: hypothetical protein QOD74_1178 [Variibacter sp.]|jgi:hypothetical protein|nr:hypothetical protein [Variibacter sp.]